MMGCHKLIYYSELQFDIVVGRCLYGDGIGFAMFLFTVRLHVGLRLMQRTVLAVAILSVCPSDACIVTKLNDGLRIL